MSNLSRAVTICACVSGLGTGIVIFADVDLDDTELSMDFAHQPLSDRKQLGTVGLWTALHGESFLQAGMHHLECQFDFDKVRKLLGKKGVESMQPFTDTPHLKQAFTVGENWPVDQARLQALVADGRLTPSQAQAFAREGAIGSHLEILQREDGFKGFNQDGITHILDEVDPREI